MLTLFQKGTMLEKNIPMRGFCISIITKREYILQLDIRIEIILMIFLNRVKEVLEIKNHGNR